MKILAIEKELRGVSDTDYKPHLEAEARKAWELHQEGLIRELYFTDDHCAVLVLEARDKVHARYIVEQLPLVQQKLIDFDFHILNTYPGFQRLFKT
ncbi:MAG TPA: superoxide dismutase [Prolixibacteraceae bacterium]|nr:superoxide dismutase [Prolixibacteraceae bacterium]